MDFPNNLSATRKYKSNRNVVNYVQNEMNDTTISKYNYTNDAAGKRTDVERTGTAFSQSDEIVYNYNDRSEVTGAESSVDDGYDYSYAYDNIGNRQLSSRELNRVCSFNRDYTPDNLNQYDKIRKEFELSTRRWEWTFDWDTQPKHDKDGNMTYMPSWTGNWELTWNAENRLVKAVSAYTKLEFTYDYKGRRIQKKVFERDTTTDDWSLHTDHRFIYNGWNLIYTAKTTDSSQPSSFAKASEDRQRTVKTYTWGLDLSGNLQGAGGVGGLLAVNINEVEAEPKSRPGTASGHQASSVQNPFFTTYDANGNVSEYVDTNSNTAAHYEYSPFGRLTAATGDKAADFNHRFSTKYQNNETGLYYYGYRYYSAELERWLSRDPIGEDGGIALYVFTNNSVNEIDILGLSPNYDVYYDLPASFRKCASISMMLLGGSMLQPTSAMLFQHWLWGSGDKSLAYESFDKSQDEFEKFVSNEKSNFAEKVRGKPCGATIREVVDPEPKVKNSHLIMVLGYTLDLKAIFSGMKKCNSDGCCKEIQIHAQYEAEATDRTDFDPGKKFCMDLVNQTVCIADSLVKACFLGGSPFDIKGSFSTTRGYIESCE